MRSSYLCQCDGCDAPAVKLSGRIMCGGHWHRVSPDRRREMTAALLSEDWPRLEELGRGAVLDVDALEAGELVLA